jgi:hypothetical protein
VAENMGNFSAADGQPFINQFAHQSGAVEGKRRKWIGHHCGQSAMNRGGWIEEGKVKNIL